MALGGAVCGSMVGCLVGGFFGLLHGVIQGDPSIGLDGALLGGLLGGNAGLAFGACLRPPPDQLSSPQPDERPARSDRPDELPILPGAGPEWLPVGDLRPASAGHSASFHSDK
jgi:hypothetical protein